MWTWFHKLASPPHFYRLAKVLIPILAVPGYLLVANCGALELDEVRDPQSVIVARDGTLALLDDIGALLYPELIAPHRHKTGTVRDYDGSPIDRLANLGGRKRVPSPLVQTG